MKLIRGLLAGLLALAPLVTGCAPSEQETEFLARKAFLLRQNQGIRELIGEAERGSLVPADRFMVGISDTVVAEILRSQLPLERPLGKQFVVHFERANVSFRDKFGVITIEGNVNRIKTPDRKTAVRVHGGLGSVVIDPKTGMLNVEIAIDRVELLQAGILEQILGAGGKRFVAQKGRELLKDALPTLTVPVALARDLKVPALDAGAVQLDSLVVPLDLSVERVLAAGGKLWLTLHAEVGEVRGGEEGVGVAVGKKKGTK
ncbi:MAG: hypothetical protein ACREOU_15985 [Candidatus Eiseniibacteriota bacterium]